MTIKAKRARALPLRTQAELDRTKNGYPGGDETVPAAATAALTAAGYKAGPAFMEYLGAQLGRYREQDAHLPPTLATQCELAAEAADAAAQARMRLTSLPPDVDILVDEGWRHFHDELFFAFARRLEDDLMCVEALLKGAQRDLATQGVRAGPRVKWYRDRLLSNVADRLVDDLGAERAAGVAAAVLRACGIDAPTDDRKARAIVRKWKAR